MFVILWNSDSNFRDRIAGNIYKDQMLAIKIVVWENGAVITATFSNPVQRTGPTSK